MTGEVIDEVLADGAVAATDVEDELVGAEKRDEGGVALIVIKINLGFRLPVFVVVFGGKSHGRSKFNMYVLSLITSFAFQLQLEHHYFQGRSAIALRTLEEYICLTIHIFDSAGMRP